MQLFITNEHKKKGFRRNIHHCPIALAIQELTGLKATVGGSIYLKSNRWDWKVIDDISSPLIGDFVGAFDCGNKQTPSSIEIPLKKEHYKQCED